MSNDWYAHEKKMLKTVTDDQLASKIWRIQNLYPIKNKLGRLQPMTLNPHQWKLVDLIADSPTDPIALLKSRQIGGTTFCVIFFLDEVCWNGGVSAAIVAHLDKSIKDIFRIATLAFENMPEAFKDKQVKSSRVTETEIFIKNNESRLEVQLEIRSKAITHILWSEYAFMKQDRITASAGSLTPNCFTVYESTPNGINQFHDLYFDLKPRKRTLFVPWFHQDEYKTGGDPIKEYTIEERKLIKAHNLTSDQIRFRRDKIIAMGAGGVIKFKQEYPEDDIECFALSGASIIDRRLIMEQVQYSREHPPVEKFRDSNLEIKVYKKFTDEEINEKNPAFFVGVDPAEGVGRDYSAVVVIANYSDYTSETVMTMRGFEEPYSFALLIKKYMEKYYTYKDEDGDDAPPLLVVERNNHGHTVLSQFKYNEEAFYPKLFYDKDFKAGFLTTQITKKHMQTELISSIQEGLIKLRDITICKEITTLSIQENGTIKAEEGCHDDMFMAAALANWGVNRLLHGINHDDVIESGHIDEETGGLSVG